MNGRPVIYADCYQKDASPVRIAGPIMGADDAAVWDAYDAAHRMQDTSTAIRAETDWRPEEREARP